MFILGPYWSGILGFNLAGTVSVVVEEGTYSFDFSDVDNSMYLALV